MNLLCIQDQPVDTGKAGVLQISHMCSAFAELGVQVTLAIPSYGKTAGQVKNYIKELLGKEPLFSVVVYKKKLFFGRFGAVGGYLGVHKLLKQFNNKPFDYCYIRNYFLIKSILKYGSKVIFESHSAVLHDNIILNTLKSRYLVRCSKHKGITVFVSISNSLYQYWIKKGVPLKKSLALHDGFEANDFLNPPKPDSVRMQLGLPKDKKIIVYTGSLYADREIESIIKLAKTYRETVFLVVGGPNNIARTFSKKALQQGVHNIQFIGRVPHFKVKDYLFAADILLMVWGKNVRTIKYCSPLKLFEYMAAGKIIVGHGFPTIHEVLNHKENALLSDPDSFEELLNNLNRAIQMPRKNKMAEATRKLAFEKYSWNKRAKSILNFIKKNEKEDIK